MRIKLEDIPKEGKQLVFLWGQESIQSFLAPKDPHGIAIPDPLSVEIYLFRKASQVHVTGSIRGKLNMVCHRCLESFSFPLEISVETFLQRKPTYLKEDEVELSEEDLLWEFFDGDEIDVDLLVAEEIFLSLPQVLLCSEDCKGLCPVCGKNLNIQTCSCKRMEFSPFETLKELRDSFSS